MSIVEVAKRAGVSPATVSLVINGRPHVAPKTMRAVRAAMAELGYTPPPPEHRPGPRPSARTSRRTGRLALVVWNMPQAWLRVPVYTDVLHGVETALRERDMGLMLHQVASDSDFHAGPLRGTVDGLILLGRRAQEFGPAVRQFCCVRIMGSLEEEDWCDHVTYRNNLVGRLAAQHLLRNGHRHCAYLGPSDLRGIWDERARTFCDTIKEAGGTVAVLQHDGLFALSGDSQCADYARMSALVDRFLASEPRATGVFLPADVLTASAYFILLVRGLKPGVDVELVSCNNETPVLAPLHPRPAVVDIHAQEVGRRAVEHLLWRLEHPRELRTNIQLDPSLEGGGVWKGPATGQKR